MVAIEARVEISPRLIADQFVTAFEGGSTYWLREARLKAAECGIPKTGIWYDCESVFAGKFIIVLRFDDPDKPEGNGQGRFYLNENNLRDGLAALSKKSPYQFGQVLAGEGDAITADIFLQCLVFGEAIYG